MAKYIAMYREGYANESIEIPEKWDMAIQDMMAGKPVGEIVTAHFVFEEMPSGDFAELSGSEWQMGDWEKGKERNDEGF